MGNVSKFLKPPYFVFSSRGIGLGRIFFSMLSVLYLYYTLYFISLYVH